MTTLTWHTQAVFWTFFLCPCLLIPSASYSHFAYCCNFFPPYLCVNVCVGACAFLPLVSHLEAITSGLGLWGGWVSVQWGHRVVVAMQRNNDAVVYDDDQPAGPMPERRARGVWGGQTSRGERVKQRLDAENVQTKRSSPEVFITTAAWASKWMR